ncbi:phospho-sugar mutase, partial [Candidatus Berkelbacteria bacterium]|nr:phospho-sugar mutase [Candidatus Berkelbacteria bacterium]
MEIFSQFDQVVKDKKLVKSAADAIKLWLDGDEFKEFKDEVLKLVNEKDWTTLNSNFYQHIEFGTGGIRGTTGVGPNRINKRTIGEAAQGFAN